jgi:hypothetical protein
MKQVTSLNDDDDENEDRQNSSGSSSTTSSTGTTTTSLSSSTRRQKLKNGLDVLPEEEDDLNNEDGGFAIPVPERKMSENKLLQTDITYGKANKRIQVWKIGKCTYLIVRSESQTKIDWKAILKKNTLLAADYKK